MLEALFTEGLLYLGPLLALLAPLLRGRFVGESAIQRLRARGAPRRVRPASSIGAARPTPVAAPRGSALLASSLAVRPPPLASLT
jgi:hypothetical protein